MEKKKVSISDVAQRAGVSITTVSRVINNVPTVSKKNRIKVEEAIAHLHFQPDVSAQRLASGVNNSIGLVIPGYPGIFHSFYAIEVIRGVGHSCETLQLDMVFHITNGLNPLNSTHVGGIVFADVIENRRQVEAALKNGTPCFVVNHKVEDFEVNYIAVDNVLGGELAGDYLSGFGHKKIATITGDINTQSGFQRLQGFTKILKKKQISLPEDYVLKGDYSRRSARLAAEKILTLADRPTAVFAASDDMALEAIAVFLENGIKIPEDISVVGFDDNPICLYGPVALTTIKQPLFEMAKDAVHYLYEMMKGKTMPTQKILLKPELIVRDSCAPSKG
ncbi:MAG: LacI family DNA-binding transcriptional regulator [Candidatus Omnitrophica bacterium]|nr:LacI family DNA-binding transcriptional regulator [Candidatus Omnitrophota bacterium]